MRVGRVLLSYVTCPAVHLSMLSHKKGKIFGKKVIEHKMRFDFLYNFCLKHFSLQEELSEIWLYAY